MSRIKNNRVKTDKYKMTSMRSLGTAHTIGDLKKMIKDYPDDISFGFRNQLMQCLYEIKYPDQTFICFQ